MKTNKIHKTKTNTQGLLILTIALTFMSFERAQAGPITGGGGFVVTCAENPIEPERTVLLDIFEGEMDPYFKMRKSTGTLEQEYSKSTVRLQELTLPEALSYVDENRVQNSLKSFARRMKFVETASELPQVYDVGELHQDIPSQCKLQQMAFLSEQDDTIYVLRGLWNKLDPLNQAALVYHELAYYGARQVNETDSRLARRVVYHIFSESIKPSVAFVEPKKKEELYLIHTLKKTQSLFRYYRETKNYGDDIYFYPVNIYALPVVGQTWFRITVPKWNLKLSYDPSNNTAKCVVVEKNVNIQTEQFIEGNFFNREYSARIRYVTGEPLLISIIKNKDQTVLAQGEAIMMSNCQ